MKKKNCWKLAIYQQFIRDKSVIFQKNRRFFRAFFACLPFLMHACCHAWYFCWKISQSPKYRWYFADFWAIFPPINNQWPISFRPHPISDISPKYWRKFPIFQTMILTHQALFNFIVSKNGTWFLIRKKIKKIKDGTWLLHKHNMCYSRYLNLSGPILPQMRK